MGGATTKEYRRQYYLRNRDKILEAAKKYHLRHGDTRRKRQQVYLENNREEINARRRAHYRSNKRLMQARAMNWALEHYYKISRDEYDALLRDTPSCKICSRNFDDSLKPCLDHCHKTGKVRGILCKSCNSKLGWLERNLGNIKEYIGTEF